MSNKNLDVKMQISYRYQTKILISKCKNTTNVEKKINVET